MGIKSIYTDTAGQVNVNPRRVKIISYDNLATVTSAGYLNALAVSTFVIYPTDIIDMIYDYSDATDSGTYDEFLPSFSNGVITLVQVPPSGVVLPTIANHIAVYTDTNGNLSEDAATAINGGNIQAGLSGTAGHLTSHPSTASRGFLRLEAINNSANYAVTIRNASHGQATVYSIPDSGAATANFITSASAGTQSITSGNLSVAGSITSVSGNITSGSSGDAGTFISFPATAANGTLIVAASNAGGAFNTTISNGTMAQSSVYTIPDVSNAAGRFLVGATATPFVSGNFPVASGTGGLMVDSGLSAANIQNKTNIIANSTSDIGGGGAGPISVVVAGLTASSKIVATIASSSNAVAVAKCVATATGFDITFTADPGAACVVNYVAFIVAQ